MALIPNISRSIKDWKKLKSKNLDKLAVPKRFYTTFHLHFV